MEQWMVAAFDREEARFFKNIKEKDVRNNAWKEVPLEEASHVRFEDTTECVCLIRARKENP